jgi:hypothetical protein
MDAVVLKSDVRLLEREELEAEVKQEIRHLRERLDPSSLDSA